MCVGKGDTAGGGVIWRHSSAQLWALPCRTPLDAALCVPEKGQTLEEVSKSKCQSGAQDWLNPREVLGAMGRVRSAAEHQWPQRRRQTMRSDDTCNR